MEQLATLPTAILAIAGLLLWALLIKFRRYIAMCILLVGIAMTGQGFMTGERLFLLPAIIAFVIAAIFETVIHPLNWFGGDPESDDPKGGYDLAEQESRLRDDYQRREREKRFR